MRAQALVNPVSEIQGVAGMASQQWDSDLGDNNNQNSHSKDATYRRKSYEPFR